MGFLRLFYIMKTHIDGSLPKNNEIFVFGSNLAGRHGAGAAKIALNYGAKYGMGIGLQGNSYAIPTKDHNLRVLSIQEIQKHINQFLEVVKDNPNKQFFLTRIGCGLAGYQDHQIAHLFQTYPNISFPIQWVQYVQ